MISGSFSTYFPDLVISSHTMIEMHSLLISTAEVFFHLMRVEDTSRVWFAWISRWLFERDSIGSSVWSDRKYHRKHSEEKQRRGCAVDFFQRPSWRFRKRKQNATKTKSAVWFSSPEVLQARSPLSDRTSIKASRLPGGVLAQRRRRVRPPRPTLPGPAG